MKLLINNLQMISPLETESKRTNRKWKLLIEVSTGYEVKFDGLPVGLRDPKSFRYHKPDKIFSELGWILKNISLRFLVSLNQF